MGVHRGGKVLNDTWTKMVIDNPEASRRAPLPAASSAKKSPRLRAVLQPVRRLGKGTLAMLGAGIWPSNYYTATAGEPI